MRDSELQHLKKKIENDLEFLLTEADFPDLEKRRKLEELLNELKETYVYGERY